MMKQTTDDELELQVGVAKVSKYAVSESGDTLEVTERPHGGLSLVLAQMMAWSGWPLAASLGLIPLLVGTGTTAGRELVIFLRRQSRRLRSAG